MLINKKRYAGLRYIRNKQGEVVFDELDAKGIEVVRRDNCMLAKQTYTNGLNALMFERNIDLCCERVAEQLNKMCTNDFAVEDYIVTKQLKKEYVNEEAQPHKQVVEKMRARRPGSEPQIGDRVPYVIVESKKKNAKVAERAEDPEYVKRNPSIKIDRVHYAETQIVNPISALLEPVIGEAPIHMLQGPLSVLRRQRDQQSTLGNFLKPKDSGDDSVSKYQPASGFQITNQSKHTKNKARPGTQATLGGFLKHSNSDESSRKEHSSLFPIPKPSEPIKNRKNMGKKQKT